MQEDAVSISGSGRSLGAGNGNPLQYSYLENPIDRGTWWATVHRVAKSQTQASNAAAAKSLQSCPTLCDPRDGSPPGSPVPGILQARTLEWVAISFSNASLHDSHVISAWLLRDQCMCSLMISVWSASWSVHDQPRNQCMCSLVISV